MRDCLCSITGGKISTAISDQLRKKKPKGGNAPQYLLSQRPLELPQGTYNIVVEVGDRNSGTIGTFRAERLFSVSESRLDMSDLLLAKKD